MTESEPRRPRVISWPQAAFIGVAAMVGAGIFSLLGAAGEVAGAAVWLSFVLAGIIAGPGLFLRQTRCPRIRRRRAAGIRSPRLRDGHFTGIAAWMTYSVNTIVTAMVAVSFGSYASAMFANESEVWAKVFAALIVLIMMGVNISGSTLVARAQSVIVFHCHRHPRGVRGRHHREHGLLTASPIRVSTASGDLLQRGSHVLRVPRLPHRYVHSEGPSRALP